MNIKTIILRIKESEGELLLVVASMGVGMEVASTERTTTEASELGSPVVYPKQHTFVADSDIGIYNNDAKCY